MVYFDAFEYCAPKDQFLVYGIEDPQKFLTVTIGIVVDVWWAKIAKLMEFLAPDSGYNWNFWHLTQVTTDTFLKL